MNECSRLTELNREKDHLLKGDLAILDGSRIPCINYINTDLKMISEKAVCKLWRPRICLYGLFMERISKLR